MITSLGEEMLSTHISSPRNVIYSHFFAKKRYQPAGSVITFLRREIVRPITDIMPHQPPQHHNSASDPPCPAAISPNLPTNRPYQDRGGQR